MDDLTLAFRSARTRPFHSVALVLVLALGVAGNIVLFQATRHMLLAPLPYLDPSRLVMILSGPEDRGIGLTTPGQILHWRTQSVPFVDIAAISLWTGSTAAQIDLFTDQGVQRLRGAIATPNTFETLGVMPMLGTLFSSAGCDGNAVVLSHDTWQRYFRGDPAIVGQLISLSQGSPTRTRQAFRVAAILPEQVRFTYPLETELWTCLSWDEVRRAPSASLAYYIVARLKPGIEEARAVVEMNHLASQARAASAEDVHLRRLVRLMSLHHFSFGNTKPALTLLAVSVLLLFVLAGANAGCLVLARLEERQTELLTRLAIGSSNVQLLRLVWAESGLLLAAGTAVGLLVAAGGISVLTAALPEMFSRAADVRFDAAALPIALLMSLGIGAILAFGIRTCVNRIVAQQSLARGDQHVTGTRNRWRMMLLTAQVASTAILVAGALMLVTAFLRLRVLDAGFQTDGVFAGEIRLLDAKYRTKSEVERFTRTLLTEIAAIDGVLGAAVATSTPLGSTDLTRVVRRAGDSVGIVAAYRAVDPDYFSILRIPVRMGSVTAFQSDTGGAKAFVSESLAASMFGEQSPVGRIIVIGQTDAEVVGVVGDIRNSDIWKDPRPALYLNRSFDISPLATLLVSVDATKGDVVQRVDDVAKDIDPHQPIGALRALSQLKSASIADRRFYSLSTSLFSVLALLLVVTGTYAVVARSVARRHRELAIRAALGARPLRVLLHAGSEAIQVAVVGIAIGLLGTLALARGLDAWLIGFRGSNPWIAWGVAGLILSVSLAASLWPTVRALRSDFLDALREQ